ncbi:hypothetical protein BGZ81_000056 [Podila clonocystis]|nr:hypothetical protein BGZ81_000056 [Podila clonocystis]
MHSCDIVLGIQELQDMLRTYLTVKDFKTCTVISRNWNRTASLPHGKRGNRWKALRRNGIHVAVLHQCAADRKTLQFLGKYLSTIESLSLSFQKYAWITYNVLEDCFGRLTKLNTLRINVDGSQFSPAMLWSLSQLRSLTKLTLCVFYHDWFITRHYTSKDYLAILDCCSQVKDLCVLGAFMEPELGVFYIKNSIGHQVQKAFSCPEFAPATPQQAINRLQHMRSSSTLNLTKDSNQRTMFSSRKTQLEAIQGIRSASQLSLPSLKDPDFSRTAVLDPVTGQRPKLPPLTQLHLTGTLRQPFRVLMHILTLIPGLEYLVVGLSLHSIEGFDQATAPSSLYSFDWPWRSIDTLAHLDVSGIRLKEPNLARFFRQVQHLKKLIKLGVSMCHVREAIELTPLGPSGEYLLPGTEDAFFFFPTVKTTYIGSTISRSGQVPDAATYDEMVFVIESMPEMRTLELKHLSVAGMIDMLSYDYTGIKFC